MVGLMFKQIFPTWQDFRKFVLDFSVYYPASEYTEDKILIYYSLLYRKYGNSHTAYPHEIFLENLSLLLAENFKEFFRIKELIDVLHSTPLKDLLLGIETITNTADKPNLVTDADTIVNYIGQQVRSRSKENIVDRVFTIIGKIQIFEITNEVNKYSDLFVQVIPRTRWLYDKEGGLPYEEDD